MRGYFDFETWDWVNPLCCAILRDDGTEYWIHDRTHKRANSVAEQAILHMYAHPEVKFWYAHNMGKFDGLFLIAAAVRLGWNVEAALAGGNRIISLRMRPPGKSREMEILDSYAIVSSSLESCAKEFDLPSAKLFTKTDYSIDARKWNKDKLRTGCFADCYVLRDLLHKVDSLVTEWGGEVKRTAASTAIGIVKANLKTQEIKLQSHFDNPSFNYIGKPAYYGARVEVFEHTPKETLIEYDVCSSYPWSMSQPVPWKPIAQVSGKECERHYRAGESMLVRAKVSVPQMHIPPLPFRPDEKTGVFFPTGEWEAWFPACELTYAEGLGCKVKPIEGLLYTTATPFERFINSVYKLKSEGKGAVRNFAKLLLNSCYGKFGEKPEHTSLRVFPTEYESLQYQIENPDTANPLSDDERILAITNEKWANHAHYGIASYITARSRILLHSYILQSMGVAYCDTDSVHCVSYSGKTGKELGQLKVEIPEYRGEFFAPKIYRLTEPSGKIHLACKGFPVNEHDFAALIASEGVNVERMQLAKTQLRKGADTVSRIRQVKSWRGLSMKRKPFPDGATRPWTVTELLAGCQKEAVSPALMEGI